MSAPASEATTAPALFGILHRHLDGDAALLRLAQAQLERARMGAEVYPTTVDEALAEWQYVPHAVSKHMVHLPRNWDAFASADRDQVLAFARALAGRVRGLVFHDRSDWAERAHALADALAPLDQALGTLDGQPMLFLEYAAGLEPESYVRVLERVAHLPHISACVDTGHVTVFAAQRWLATRHPHLQAWTLDPNDHALGRLAPDFEQAARQANDDLIGLVQGVARLHKPMHFHLHDGHLLSRLSRYQVCDHLPFGQRIPVTPALAPEGSLPTMVGSAGLRRILAATRSHLPAAEVSLTLEIHPHLGLRPQPLGEWAGWFAHWTDRTNAELTHAWLDQVTEQAGLVRRLWSELG